MYTSPKVDVSSKLHRCFLRRSTDRTARFMTFVANQLVRLFGAHFYLALTSLPTSCLVCSVLDSSPTNWFGLFVASSPAKLGTPLEVGSCYVSSVCYQLTPCYSDQGADPGWHIRGFATVRLGDYNVYIAPCGAFINTNILFD